MPRYLWLRVAIVVVVAAVSLWYVYPPRQRINLGLDLQGGIHLVLGVDVDKAIENVSERTAADVRSALEKKGIGAQVTRRGATGIQVQLTSPPALADARAVLAEFPTLKVGATDPGAGRLEADLIDKEATRLRDFAVRQGLETIPACFAEMLRGDNFGKMLVQVSPDPTL